LIDTGLPDQERASRYHHNCGKRGCPQVHEHLGRKLGLHPDRIDANILTHPHWDHVQNMKKFKDWPGMWMAPRMRYSPVSDRPDRKATMARDRFHPWRDSGVSGRMPDAPGIVRGPDGTGGSRCRAAAGWCGGPSRGCRGAGSWRGAWRGVQADGIR